MPTNFLLHLFTNFFTKVADEIVSAKLVFPWVLGLLGAPLVLIALCVPIREAGVLIPQLLVAANIRAKPYRKYVWMFGSTLTSLSLWICAVALFLDLSTQAAAYWIFGALILFAAARGICSVAAKDVLGKTVSKNRRGTLMGLSTSLSGIVTVLVGLNLGWFNDIKSTQLALAGLFVLGGLCWMISSVTIWCLREQAGATEGGANGINAAIQSLSLLWTDKKFAQFVVLRFLLLGVSLGLPVVVILAQESVETLNQVGFLIVATGIANSLSGYVWGRMADRSSIHLLFVCSALQVFTVALLLWGVSALTKPSHLTSLYFSVYLMMSVILAGVRTGRKTLVVDLATAQTRAGYVAVSNTVIGLGILLVGVTVGLASANSPITMLLIYTAMTGLAALLAFFCLKSLKTA